VGSRGTYAMGSACIQAAEEARRELLDLAAVSLGVPADKLDTRDGRVLLKLDPDVSISWAAAMGAERTIMGTGRFEPDFTLANCMMTFVEVRVDTETGRVELLKVVNATDAGQIIDPPGLENQLNGCLGSAGIDTALFEETVRDRSSGRILNANMADYKWRTFAELPDMRNVVLETPVRSHRFQAIGVGEVSTAPGPAAVLMAVSNAIGVHLSEYPVTPERILRALAAPTCRVATGSSAAEGQPFATGAST
jgi:CO/xanthine dehydrogenase Mo-binding subunit